jgi:hypothetical protein
MPTVHQKRALSTRWVRLTETFRARDRFLLESIRHVPERWISSRITGQADALLTLETQRPPENLAQACKNPISLLLHTEKPFFAASAARARFDHSSVLPFGVQVALLAASQTPEALMVSANPIPTYWNCPRKVLSTERGDFSTNEIFEAGAVLNEAFLLAASGQIDEFNVRVKRISDTNYADALCYALWRFGFEAGLPGNLQHDLDLFLKGMVCIDIALDVYFLEGADMSELTDVDLYPPTRFDLALDAARAVSFPACTIDVSKESIKQVREEVKQRAHLRCSDDIVPPPRSTVERFLDDVLVKNLQPAPYGFSSFPAEKMSLYTVLAFLQKLFHAEKRRGPN